MSDREANEIGMFTPAEIANALRDIRTVIRGDWPVSNLTARQKVERIRKILDRPEVAAAMQFWTTEEPRDV